MTTANLQLPTSTTPGLGSWKLEVDILSFFAVLLQKLYSALMRNSRGVRIARGCSQVPPGTKVLL